MAHNPAKLSLIPKPHVKETPEMSNCYSTHALSNTHHTKISMINTNLFIIYLLQIPLLASDLPK